MRSVEQFIQNSLVLERRQKNPNAAQQTSNACSRTLQDEVNESFFWREPIHLQALIQNSNTP